MSEKDLDHFIRRRLADQKRLHEEGECAGMGHLLDDAPFLRCSDCGRKAYSGFSAAERGTSCGMMQPDGKPCPGVFR